MRVSVVSVLRYEVLHLAVCCAVIALAGCGREREEAKPASSDGTIAISAPGAQPYEERELTAMGRLRGTVLIDGRAPPDTMIRPASDQAVCGSAFQDQTMAVQGPRLGGVIVWLEDVRNGKRLPLDRRFEVTNERCRIVPRTQAVIAGGTLNVRSLDPVAHRTRVLHRESGETAALVSQHDVGQVVPVEDALAKPGLLEVRCDLHPWTRAWIAVFDHPYFTVSLRDGGFAMDSVPPGNYRIVAWHERFGRVEESVSIADGQTGTVTLRVRGAEP